MDGMNTAELLAESVRRETIWMIIDIIRTCKDTEEAEAKIRALLSK